MKLVEFFPRFVTQEENEDLGAEVTKELKEIVLSFQRIRS